MQCKLLLSTLLVFAAAVSGTAQADPVVPGEEHCVVNVRSNDVLNLRAEPSSSSEIIAAKRYNACGIRVVRNCRRSWCPVRDGHQVAWANRRHLAMVSPAMYCVAGVAAGDVLNLRAYPASQSRVIHRLGRHRCGIAFLPYRVGRWQKIRVAGWQGWANRSYLSAQ
jgi:hypothetical protein